MASSYMAYPVAQEASEYINVITIDDRTFRVETSSEQTLQDFRVAVAQITGIAPESQRLISSGRLLFGETQPLGLAHNSFVHLAPITVQPPSSSSNQDGDVDDGDFSSSVRLAAHMAQLNGFAWLTVIYYSLVSWRLMMVIAFEQDDITPDRHGQSKQDYLALVLVPNFIISLFGVGVGLFGLWAASYRHTPNAQWKLRMYIVLIAMLAILSFLISLQMMDSNTMMAVFIVQMMFWYCILQARITEQAYVAVHGTASSSTVPMATPQALPEVAVAPAVVIVQAQPDGGGSNHHRRDAVVMV
ncbi:hypothetical protein BASA81_001868 [Batrachochytrium salamandrivorans]|nr:hypothetical protein BASA81_001868 [Batrachochytrium salamandrivorans]